MLEKSKRKSTQELRKFGLVMAGAFGLIGGFLWWKEAPAAIVLLSISAFFLLFGIVFPTALRPIEFVWMKIAMVMGAVMTRVLLSLVFVLAVTPIGILMRMFGKDSLQLKSTSKESYWLEADTDGTAARHDKPF